MNAASERVLASVGPGRWNDLLPRLASALVLGPVVLLCVWFGGWPWLALLAAGTTVLAREWLAMVRAGSRSWMLLGAAILAAVAAARIVHPWLGLAFLLVGGLLLLRDTRLAATGALYIGVPILALALLRHDPRAGRDNMLILLFLVWASDVTAYAVGRLVGGRKLAPSISPGKTWSGAAGGLLGATSVGIVAATLLGGDPARAGVIAVLLGVMTQLGDLLESWIKRRLGVKDSGTLIPGHGGLLDRVDGLLAAALLAVPLAQVGGGRLWS